MPTGEVVGWRFRFIAILLPLNKVCFLLLKNEIRSCCSYSPRLRIRLVIYLNILFLMGMNKGCHRIGNLPKLLPNENNDKSR